MQRWHCAMLITRRLLNVWFLALLHHAIPTLPRQASPTIAWLNVRIHEYARNPTRKSLSICQRGSAKVTMNAVEMPDHSTTDQRVQFPRESAGPGIRGGTTSRGIPWTEYLRCESVVKVVMPRRPIEEKISVWRATSQAAALRGSQGENPPSGTGRLSDLIRRNASWTSTVGAMRWERILTAKLNDVEFKLRMWKSYARAARNNQVRSDT